MANFNRAYNTLDGVLTKMNQGPVEKKGGNKTTAALQKCLTDLLALSLIVHQGHWAAKGDGFHPLHLLLGTIYDEVNEIVDTVAERMATLDVAPAGQVADVSKSSLAPLPGGFVDTRKVIVEVSDRMGSVVKTLDDTRKVAGGEDPVTENMLQDMIRDVQKLQWLLRSNAESASSMN